MVNPVIPIPPTPEQIAIFRACFSGLPHVRGTYNLTTGQAFQVKKPVTDAVIRDHLLGLRPYGVYLLTGNVTRAVVADFDEEDPTLPCEFVAQAAHYGIASSLEISKKKGWHVWIFLDSAGVSARKARRVAQLILDEIGAPTTEIFPKQDCIDGTNRFGNFIHVPLFGRYLAQGRTAFVDIKNGLRPYPDQWAVLAQIVRVREHQLDEIIAINEPDEIDLEGITATGSGFQRTFGLLPCAQRMLREGVTGHQRVACFRLAVALKKAGVPLDLTVVLLLAWALKNRPEKGRRIITEAEIIEQATAAYARPYRGCGCEDAAIRPFCDAACPLHRRRRRGRRALPAGTPPHPAGRPPGLSAQDNSRGQGSPGWTSATG